MSIRKKLQDLQDILVELDRQSSISDRAKDAVIRFAEEARVQIEGMPQLSLVRPATIALRNLVASLPRAATLESVAEEIEAALEAVNELLDEPTFGFSPAELAARATAELRRLGVLICPVCPDGERSVEIVSIPIRPFPSDRSRRAHERPLAMVVCKRCGKVHWHDLAALEVM